MDCDLISFFPQVKAAFDKALARLVVLRKEIVPLHKKLQAEQARLAKEGFLSFKGKWPSVSAGACPLETASEANSNMHVASFGGQNGCTGCRSGDSRGRGRGESS